MRTSLLLLVTAMLLPFSASAQVGKNSTLWDWTAKAEHHESVVKLTVKNVSGRESTGTGALVFVDRNRKIGTGYRGYVLTAYHVVIGDQGKGTIKVTYRTGTISSGNKVSTFDKEVDVAIVPVWVPAGVKAVPLASKDANAGDKLEYAGLGGGSKLKCCLRHFSATAAKTTNGQRIFADALLLPGDSGGPVFNAQRQVVGTISGGWQWFDLGVRSKHGKVIHTTWPARSSNVGVTRKLLNEARGVTPSNQIAAVASTP